MNNDETNNSALSTQHSALSGKRVLVLGLGLHGGGAGVAKFALAQGAEVRATDMKTADQLAPTLQQLEGLPISYTLGEHRQEDFAWADIIVRNQAVPRESEWLALARRLGKTVTMEVGLFFQLCPSANIIGITGTKGKTTTTTLCHAMVQAWRPDAVVAGNISGKPPLDALPSIKADTPVVLELSSWQLEGTDDIAVSPHVACWLNLSPDHLNRYRDMADYAEAKWAIFKHQKSGDVAVMNYGDPYVRPYANQLPAGVQLLWFGETIPDGTDGGYIKGGWLILRLGNVETQLARLADLKLVGRHNALNALAAALCATAAGAPKGTIARALTTFSGVRDRMEVLRELDGVTFINDTTSTTPASTIAALDSLPQPVRLIVGGSDKRLEYDELATVIAHRFPAVRVYLLEGSATDKLATALHDVGVEPMGRWHDFATAVQAAFSHARAGEAVLLSPACASFGMFVNEFDRGDKFRQIVAALQSKQLGLLWLQLGKAKAVGAITTPTAVLKETTMADDNQAIVPRNERVVDFYGDQIPVAQTEDEELYVPLRQLATFLGLDRSAQRRRVERDPVLSKRVREVFMTSADGKRYQTLCLPLDLLPGWLFGITTARVSPELAEKLNHYREECFKVLWNAFRSDIIAATPVTTGLSKAEQTLEMISAMQQMAQQQVEMERRLAEMENRHGTMANYLRGYIQQTNQRLANIEVRLDLAATITDEQAAEIVLTVKNVAHAMESGGSTGSYGKVYSELYRRYRISSYKNLPRSKYEEVLSWLSKWYDELATDDSSQS